MSDYEPKHLKLWTMPESYFGAVWPNTYGAGFGQHRESDCLQRCNFIVALEALRAVSERVEVVHEGHWAVGWVEWLAIPADDFEALKVADELMDAYETYPVLDDDRHSAMEQEEADQVWKDCYSTKARIAYMRKHSNQFEFRNFEDMLGCARGKYFAGYASELIS